MEEYPLKKKKEKAKVLMKSYTYSKPLKAYSEATFYDIYIYTVISCIFVFIGSFPNA